MSCYWKYFITCESYVSLSPLLVWVWVGHRDPRCVIRVESQMLNRWWWKTVSHHTWSAAKVSAFSSRARDAEAATRSSIKDEIASDIEPWRSSASVLCWIIVTVSDPVSHQTLNGRFQSRQMLAALFCSNMKAAKANALNHADNITSSEMIDIWMDSLTAYMIIIVVSDAADGRHLIALQTDSCLRTAS